MSGIESEQEYDDTAKLHADGDSEYDDTAKREPWTDGDSELAGNLNNILETNKEPEDEDYNSGLKSLCQKLDKDEEIEEKIQQILQVKFDKTLILLKNSKPTWKLLKNHRNCSD